MQIISESSIIFSFKWLWALDWIPGASICADFQSDIHVVSIVKFTEMAVGYKKGKGMKSKWVLKVIASETKNIAEANIN